MSLVGLDELLSSTRRVEPAPDTADPADIDDARAGRWDEGWREDDLHPTRLRPTLELEPVIEAPLEPAPAPETSADRDRPRYVVPAPPEVGWTTGPSRRRARVSRGILLCILAVQALLSLRLRNSAFEDEALYLYAGHLHLEHLLEGAPARPEFTAYFSGSPYLYPVLGAAVDLVFGLAGARGLGLAFMLATTVLLYSLSRLLFNERVALCAAGCFAVAQSTLFLGNFATYDPPAIFLLALAAWLVVRTAHRGALLTSVLTAPVLVLAVAVKYASLMYLPPIMVLAVLAAFPHLRWRALGRGVLLPAVTAGLLTGALRLAGADYIHGVEQTTTQRAVGDADPMSLLLDSLEWGGLLLAIALVGTVLYTRQGRMGELPGPFEGRLPGRFWRLMLGTLLCGTALLAPAYQMHLHSGVSLHKHIGYGLLFAAPMAGVGITRLVGSHFRHPELAILLWVSLLIMGLTQSADQYHGWPDSTRMVATLRSQLQPGGHYLVESGSVTQYYLRDVTDYSQWTTTYAFTYGDPTGRLVSGEPAYRSAINAGYFDVIVFSKTTTPALDDKLIEHLRWSEKYRLLAKLPFRNTYGTGAYQIWVKTDQR